MDSKEIRYLKARRLVKESGGITAFAEKIGKQQSQASSFAGENPVKGIGSKIAREIETAFGKPRGWLDVPDHLSEPPGLYNNEQLSPAPSDDLVWLISWVAAGNWCEAVDIFQPGDGHELISCPEPHSTSTIALKIEGHSMDSGNEDGYRDGEIIFVDPEVEARHNSDVVVTTPDGNATFKRLQITSEGTFLMALNKDWPNRIIPIPADTRICGTVIGSYRSRRRK